MTLRVGRFSGCFGWPYRLCLEYFRYISCKLGTRSIQSESHPTWCKCCSCRVFIYGDLCFKYHSNENA
ncbi:hypothetical protein K501DRAFT_84990 [Backusella circina FSU 941]|nr:hypothetical protein K501DRAFT_84990 [Backusella circina FSU 941]